MRFEHSTGPNIPPDVWRNLSKEQLAQFLNEAMEFNREMERKRFQLEETEAARMDTAQTRRIVVGGLVVALGLAAIAHSDEADHAFQSDADHLRSEATQSSLSVEH